MSHPPLVDKDGKPRAPKNAGNTRRGATRGRNIGRVKQTPWRNDPIVRERLQVVHKAWNEGYSPTQTIALVNKWARRAIPDHPTFSLSTVQADRKRIMELVTEQDDDIRIEHLEALKHLKVRAYEELDATNVDMAKPSFLNVIRAAEETAAKIDGSLVHRSKTEVTMTSESEARILVQVLVRHLGNEEAAFKVIEDVKSAIDAESAGS